MKKGYPISSNFIEANSFGTISDETKNPPKTFPAFQLKFLQDIRTDKQF